MFRNGFSIPTIDSHTEYGDYYEETHLTISNGGTAAIVILPIDATDNPEDLQQEIEAQDRCAKNRHEVEWICFENDIDEAINKGDGFDEEDPLGVCESKDDEEDNQTSNQSFIATLVGCMLDDADAEITPCEDGVVVTAPEEEEEEEAEEA